MSGDDPHKARSEADRRDAVADQRDAAADARDLVADGRDDVADQRDAAADARDLVADGRDDIADLREAQLREWELQLSKRARRLGIDPGEGVPAHQLENAETARDAAALERKLREGERHTAAAERHAAKTRRLVKQRDALLAAAFAGIAEYLHDSQSAEELVARVAEAAVTTIAGATKASVAPHEEETPAVGSEPDAQTHAEWSMSFPFESTAEGCSTPRQFSLSVYASDPNALDQAAEDLGVILAAHSSLASRAVGERARVKQLERALSSRDVIGQAKGILMERMAISSDEAFDLLRRSSQLLNIKLREVARTLAETGLLP